MKLRLFALAIGGSGVVALVPDATGVNRRSALGWFAGTVGGWTLTGRNEDEMVAHAADSNLPDSFDVDSYLKSGFVQSPMGVSGQAGE